MLCSWGAEEHGMLGSTEWAEVSGQYIAKHNGRMFIVTF